MLVTTEYGCYSVGFRYIDNVTVARIVPMEDGELLFGESVSGVAYFNPADYAAGEVQDRKVGQEVAVRRALENADVFDEDIETFVQTFKALRYHNKW